MKKTKIALTLVCAILLVAASVMGTLAYLTATTSTVTNTFTVGNVKFEGSGLDEARTDAYGNPGKMTKDKDGNDVFTKVDDIKDADRVQGNDYTLVAGHKYTKDPTVHIAANSEDCWVFVKVVNPITSIEAKDPDEGDGTTIAAQMKKNGWEAVDAENVPGVYAYTIKYTTQTTVKDIVVFESFTLANVEGAFAETSYDDITIQAGLIQADGFDTYNAAWNANSILFDAEEE